MVFIRLQVFILVLVLALVFFLPEVQAREIQGVIEIPSSFNPVGSGARALGMGGAFIAVADDATAASWNPAGLIQLERPEISIVGAYIRRNEDNTFTGPTAGASGEQPISTENINYLSASYPFNIGQRNMIVSFNYQYLYDLHRAWKNLPWPVGPTEIPNMTSQQEGGLGALGIAYAIQVSPRISFGVTLNIWDNLPNINSWEGTLRASGQGTAFGGAVAVTYFEEGFDRYEFSGINFNLGMLWEITGKFRMGLIFKSPFTADLEHTSYSYLLRTITATGAPLQIDPPKWEYLNETLEMPMSYGIGLSYRFSDTLTVSGDFFRTHWEDYTHRDDKGVERSPVSGLTPDLSNVDPTFQIRLGAEYLIIDMARDWVIPLRAGIFYDPSPAEGSPDDYYGISLGTGIAYKRFIFDIAYQYRVGREVGTAYLEEVGLSQNVDEHTVYSSIIIHF